MCRRRRDRDASAVRDGSSVVRARDAWLGEARVDGGAGGRAARMRGMRGSRRALRVRARVRARRAREGWGFAREREIGIFANVD